MEMINMWTLLLLMVLVYFITLGLLTIADAVEDDKREKERLNELMDLKERK